MKYDDIIDLPRFEPKNHPRMSLHNRAAQFAPFAALTGYDDAVSETARIVDGMIELSDEDNEILDRKMRIIAENPENEITVTYFVPDRRKKGGAYAAKKGFFGRIDTVEGVIIMRDKTRIPISRVIDISAEALPDEPD